MSKETKNSTITSFIDNHWTDHPAVEWISNNKQTILWIIVGLFAVLILAYRILMTQTQNAEADFFRAQTDFTTFQEASLKTHGQLVDSSSLLNLELLMKKQPDLHAKYDGSLAQTLLIENQIPQAKEYAEATFKRTADDSIALYHAYAANSLIIGQKNYQEALNRAQELNSKIKNVANQSHETLYFFNVVRLALLNQQLGFAQEEKLFWNELKNYQQQANAAAAFNLFKVGQASLNQYIEKRIQALN